MKLLLSLLAGAVILNGGNAQPLTQNCGNAVCRFDETVSCAALLQENTFTGTCCSLKDNEDGTCTVSVSSGICYWQPKNPCEGCLPGTGGVFLGSGNSDGCPATTYDALPQPEIPSLDDSDQTASPTPTPQPQTAEDPDSDVDEDSAGAYTSMALGVIASAVTTLLL